VEISYELVPGTDGGPPVIRCTHHVGYVLETLYESDLKRALFSPVRVITKPHLAKKAGR